LQLSQRALFSGSQRTDVQHALSLPHFRHPFSLTTVGVLGCYSKQVGDEGDLPSDVPFAHPFDLSLANHVHHLIVYGPATSSPLCSAHIVPLQAGSVVKSQQEGQMAWYKGQ
jgi:hypothetical protein